MIKSIPMPASIQGIEIRPKGELNTRCGVAFRAEVWRDKRCIGTLENEGRGGGTWFYAATAADREWWKAACEDFAPQALIIQNAELAEFGMPPIEGGANTSEILADLLYEAAVR